MVSLRPLAAVLLAGACALSGCPAWEPDRDGRYVAPRPDTTLPGPDERGLSPGRRRPWSLPLNNPAFASVAEAGFMQPDDLVVGIVVAGRARAYPWWVMRHYHVVNDSVVVPKPALAQRWLRRFGLADVPDLVHPAGGFVPLLVTLCEACSGASAFVPVSDDESHERPLVFSQCRSTGNSTGAYNAVGVYTLCDLETQSRWHPFTGRAGSGVLEGQRLRRIPVYIDLWEKWQRKHPDTRVALGGSEMRARPHGSSPNATMGGDGEHPSYHRLLREQPGLEDTRLPRAQLVIGVESRDGESSFAYTLEKLLAQGGAVQLEFDRDEFLLTQTAELHALAFHRRLGDRVLEFEMADRPPRLTDRSGTVWNTSGAAIAGTHAGAQLELVAGSYVTEWSEWSISHPGTALPELE
jgi:hypothetical protein